METVQLPLNIQIDTDPNVIYDDGSEETLDKIDSIIMNARSDYKDFAFDVADKVLRQIESLASSDYKLVELARSMAFALGKLQGLQATVRHDLSKELQDEIKVIASDIETSLTKFNLMKYHSSKSI